MFNNSDDAVDHVEQAIDEAKADLDTEQTRDFLDSLEAKLFMLRAEL